MKPFFLIKQSCVQEDALDALSCILVDSIKCSVKVTVCTINSVHGGIFNSSLSGIARVCNNWTLPGKRPMTHHLPQRPHCHLAALFLRGTNPLSLSQPFTKGENEKRWFHLVTSRGLGASLQAGLHFGCCWGEKIVVTPIWGVRWVGSLCMFMETTCENKKDQWVTFAYRRHRWWFCSASGDFVTVLVVGTASPLASLLHCTMAELMVPALSHRAVLRLNWRIFLTHYQEH